MDEKRPFIKKLLVGGQMSGKTTVIVNDIKLFRAANPNGQVFYFCGNSDEVEGITKNERIKKPLTPKFLQLIEVEWTCTCLIVIDDALSMIQDTDFRRGLEARLTDARHFNMDLIVSIQKLSTVKNHATILENFNRFWLGTNMMQSWKSVERLCGRIGITKEDWEKVQQLEQYQFHKIKR